MRKAIFINSAISLVFWSAAVVGAWMKLQGDTVPFFQQQALLLLLAAFLPFIVAATLFGIRYFQLYRVFKREGIDLSGRNFFRRSVKNWPYQRERWLQTTVLLWLPFLSLLIHILLQLIVMGKMDYGDYQSLNDTLSLTGQLGWPLALLLYALLSKDVIFQRSQSIGQEGVPF